MSKVVRSLARGMRGLGIFALLLNWEVVCADDFRERVAPVFERHCLRCHNDEDKKGGLSLARRASLLAGGDSGSIVDLAQPQRSLLLSSVSGESPEMPKNSPALSKAEVAALEAWIRAGAAWPEAVVLKDRQFDGQSWWSQQPLSRPAVPALIASYPAPRNPVDAFIHARLAERKLTPSPVADRATLIRRVTYDLHGLPPDPDDVVSFVADSDPTAYERLVDRLLASPRYGERWARHWLDVVHYGDTHGYDKDKLRPNAWPYRDYVIRALNEDKPYDQFIQEQLAGDILWAGTVDGITATGFIAAGPWDFIGHAEVPESKIDGQIARNLDRDDMVTTTLNAFCSLTVQCARCHNHKFDPVTQQDYYRLQAVFAAVDRADREFDLDPGTARERSDLRAQQQQLKSTRQRLDDEIQKTAGAPLKELNQRLAAAESSAAGQRRPEYGYHSAIEPAADTVKWVQVDLGRQVALSRVAHVGCWDDFNAIGAGFGFPRRYRIEASNDPQFERDVVLLVDRTQSDFPNPGTALQSSPVSGVTARYVRVTATRLAPRQNDFIFALAELLVFDADGVNVAAMATVTALDSIEAPIRWSRKNLVDGVYTGQGADDVTRLRTERDEMLQRLVPQAVREELARTDAALEEVQRRLKTLPLSQTVYAGMVYSGGGAFTGTGASGGKPRTIRILKRGDVTTPAEEVGPGIVPLIPGESGEFALPPDHSEGQRRVALARWITDERHPLTWRSMANRVWQFHLGRGIVDSPNDFGRMGQLPTHPELLDWLACSLRDRGETGPQRSLKQLHRTIVLSGTYQQSSQSSADDAASAAQVDSTNSLYWRANRRKLDAEALRDTMLLVAGRLDDRLGGPAFQDFVIEKPEHSPHYEYHLHNVEDPRSHRRSIYRFLVRSQTQPFMTTLDCADPSMIVDKRNETVTALQALALMNNKLVLAMSRHLAQRLTVAAATDPDRLDLAFQLALCRRPTPEESAALLEYTRQHGLPQACRVILNLNEFAFVD